MVAIGCLAQDTSNAGHMKVTLQPDEVKQAVMEAVEIVKEQIEIVEPHIFKNGELISYGYYR